MSDLATVLARMLHQTGHGVNPEQVQAESEAMLATPQGKALAALVAAAEAWRDIDDDFALITDGQQLLEAAIDAYREATR